VILKKNIIHNPVANTITVQTLRNIQLNQHWHQSADKVSEIPSIRIYLVDDERPTSSDSLAGATNGNQLHKIFKADTAQGQEATGATW